MRGGECNAAQVRSAKHGAYNLSTNQVPAIRRAIDILSLGLRGKRPHQVSDLLILVGVVVRIIN